MFNNAGVTSGGGGKPWQQEPNDWRWCFGVNVFGTAFCTSEFVPRMIEGGEPGQIVNTSSGDGGFAPVPTASVYAASKAAVSCFTEALHHNLVAEGTDLRASVFYPSGGLLRTGLFTATRNRPEHLRRQGAGTGRAGMTFDQMKQWLADAGHDVAEADLDELGDFVVDEAPRRRFVIGRDLDGTVDPPPAGRRDRPAVVPPPPASVVTGMPDDATPTSRRTGRTQARRLRDDRRTTEAGRVLPSVIAPGTDDGRPAELTATAEEAHHERPTRPPVSPSTRSRPGSTPGPTRSTRACASRTRSTGRTCSAAGSSPATTTSPPCSGTGRCRAI